MKLREQTFGVDFNVIYVCSCQLGSDIGRVLPKIVNTCNVATIGFLYFGPYSTLQKLLKSSLISEAYAKIIINEVCLSGKWL